MIKKLWHKMARKKQYWAQHTWTWLPLHDLARWPYYKTKISVFLRNCCVLSRLTYRVSQKYFLKSRFAKPGLRLRGLPLPVQQPTGNARPLALKPGFAKRQFRKCVFFGTPCRWDRLRHKPDNSMCCTKWNVMTTWCKNSNNEPS